VLNPSCFIRFIVDGGVRPQRDLNTTSKRPQEDLLALALALASSLSLALSLVREIL
jgi:hypothetical protein